ncbi:PREDICTED: alpha-N-acetylgalactosaminide alpha-2,6-sialyltransferase 3-like, partial [Apaloderma vittatum]|uniref:alpha-N-acetylgalactosaminide alpha-2,6-sialyltransferase 3-like n=1 Tax=Apaloderma vittatum TaxID=57397 RepID=UPI000521A0D7
MQVSEDLVKGTSKPLIDVLGPEVINSNGTGICMGLPVCINPIAAGPPLQIRGQPALPARPIFGFSDKAADDLVFNCYPGVRDVDTCKQIPLQLDCNLCAIVSNSGQMAGQKVGAEIDRSSCIWRMNNAPTKGYEEDVGQRTTVRVVSHTSVPLLLKNPEYFFKETNNTVYVIWGPFRNMRKDGNGIVYNMLKKTVDSYPTAKIYVTTEKRMSYCDAVFKRETGKDR